VILDNLLEYTRASFDWSADSLRFSPTVDAWAKKNLYYVQEAGRFRTYSGYLTERQNLESYLMVYTHRGRGKLIYNGKESHLTNGDFFWIDCKNRHIYQTCGDEGWDFDWVHFYGHNIEPYFDMFQMQYEQSSVRHQFSADKISILFERLLELQTKRGTSPELETSSVIYNLIIEALLIVSNQLVPNHKLHKSVAQAVDYMEKNIEKKIKLDDIASVVNIDKYYLIKLFKRHTGLTPFEWLQKARISRAKELLILSEKSVEEIGFEVGYTPASYFISTFKISEGLTPLRYRQQWQYKVSSSGSTRSFRL
jgi:AraC-like DNA-binding protein